MHTTFIIKRLIGNCEDLIPKDKEDTLLEEIIRKEILIVLKKQNNTASELDSILQKGLQSLYNALTTTFTSTLRPAYISKQWKNAVTILITKT